MNEINLTKIDSRKNDVTGRAKEGQKRFLTLRPKIFVDSSPYLRTCRCCSWTRLTVGISLYVTVHLLRAPIPLFFYFTRISLPMSRIDNFINKRIPGSMPLKAFVASVIVCAAAAYPVFKKPPEESRQGHDYMSSEKPEAIRASQEQLRKEYRRKRNEAEEAEKSKKSEN